MDARLKELLKPEILNTMDGLELVARIIVEGFMSGSNKSQAIGVGQEFSQYRNYEPGDDLRQLDWKMYARSERYFIKQAEIETNITVKFMVDASNSMAYEEDGITKLQFAKIIVAALAYLARKQGDTFGLYTVNDEHVTMLQPRFEQQQFMRFLHELVQVKPMSSWKKSGVEQLFDHHGKEMIVFITDLYDEALDLIKFISRLKTSKNEVIVFHLMGKHETELDHAGAFTFRDLESGAMVKVDTRAQQKQYAEKVKQWVNDSRLSLLEKGINYHLVRMDELPEQILRDFLKARKNLMR
ncbi:DUF58 domain-containing protein [Fulvivirgaceae bacterium PWU4]|uniref:DUF58 domain-containing protein n=1 Tax=Chryseosolibacter histidini TaxID=2782349 RepID=A0AAP2GQW1_9BACT|nr:DUF58 domain-containing protein [Chryseosolibacter histidini]MBT1699385.1 DUF58 domain-containing protein [Chryseosolibacter histidini]